jgi:predicted O-methyltransferase YrrM
MTTRGLVSAAEADLLYGLARDVSEGVIVEIGAYRGRSSVALARGSRAGSRVPVFAVDPHARFQLHAGAPVRGPKDRAAFFRTMLRTGCYRDVRLINLSSEEITPGWTRPVDLLWIDGDHSHAGVRRDLSCWWPHLHSGSVVAFDDSVDPGSGPATVIAEEVGSGRLRRERSVGKISVLRVL